MRKPRRRSGPSTELETLEVRQLLSAVTAELRNGTLTVVGSGDSDTFSVVAEGSRLVVREGANEDSFALNQVDRLVINGGSGDDNITHSSAVAATITGGAGNDTILGGTGADFINGGSGNDRLTGRAGNDTVFGSTGRDRISGGSGNDELFSLSSSEGTESTRDELRGGSGRDLIVGQSTVGVGVWAGNGRDTISGDSGNDTLRGQNGDDRIAGGSGDDLLEGNSGDDELLGGAGNDSLFGFVGNDVLFAGSGADFLSGSSGNDALDGGDGADEVVGGADSDFVVGGRGRDTLTGGGSEDILVAGQQAAFQNTYADILAEWTSTRSYLNRRQNIIDGSGGTRANGSSFVQTQSDGVRNVLIGSVDNDVFFADTSLDVSPDLTLGESLEQTGSCALNSQEQGIAGLVQGHPLQGRASSTCHLTLSQVARARAQDMATRGFFGHVNPDGNGPNRLVQEAGYVLPEFYSQTAAANNIESILAGVASFEEAFDLWLGSPAHRRHLLAETEFNADQIEFGVGYAFNPDSEFQHYYVFISAFRE